LTKKESTWRMGGVAPCDAWLQLLCQLDETAQAGPDLQGVAREGESFKLAEGLWGAVGRKSW